MVWEKTVVVAIMDTLAPVVDDLSSGFGSPFENAKWFLEKLKTLGYFVIISDPTFVTQFGVRAGLNWLILNELPYDDLVLANVPPARFYVNGRSPGWQGLVPAAEWIEEQGS